MNKPLTGIANGDYMQPFSLTLKNCRCFTDEHPLQLEIASGFTAFVGPNNSGKSSALRVFYEFRHCWAPLRDHVGDLINRGEAGVGGGVIHDPDEIFSNLNLRDMHLTLEFPVPPEDGFQYLSRVVVTFPRKQWGIFRVRFFATSGGQEREIPHGGINGMTERGISLQSIGEVDLVSYREVMTAFCDAMYIGAFRNAINQGAGQYYDIHVGTGFVSLWNSWKVGAAKSNMDRVLAITEVIRDLFDFDHLEINASANDQNLVVVVNRRSYFLNELGSGLAQFIIVLGNVVIRKPSLILIDEPELNLHPSLQQKFLFQLASYASEGTVFATHSLGLARSTTSNIFSFQLRDGASFVHRFEATPSFGEFMGELSFSSYRELGFEKVLLVEGVTDAPVYREFLRKLKADHKVLVIPLGGNQLARGDVEHELSELKRISEKVFALVDSERPAEDQPPIEPRLAFKRSCDNVDIPVLLTDKRATENYLSERAIKEVFGQDQRAFGPYETRKDVKPAWKKEDNWQVAAVMTLDELRATDVGKYLEDVVVA